MLLQFSARNFKSFKDSFTLDLFTKKDSSVSAIYKSHFGNAYSSAVFYGANGSGKSNVLQAFNMMRRLVLNTDKIIQSTDVMPINRFKLSSESEDDTTAFDICFIYNNKKYKYGFEYGSEYDQQVEKTVVYSEYLYVYESVQPTIVFSYDLDDMKTNDFKIKITKYKDLEKVKHLKNSLFLVEADRNDNAEAKNVLNWFNSTRFIEYSQKNPINPKYWDNLNNPNTKEIFQIFMKDADFGIKDIFQESQPVNKIAQEIKGFPSDLIVEEVSVKTLHKKYDENKKYLGDEKFNLFDDESLGTQKYFYVIGPVISALRNGTTLFLDELDASLHPILTRKIVEFFNNPELNINGGQLIFTSQDTNLLDQTLFDKEQIWFTEKDKYGCSYLTSLAEYKNIRKEHKIERDYIMGKYGAIPYLGEFRF